MVLDITAGFKGLRGNSFIYDPGSCGFLGCLLDLCSAPAPAKARVLLALFPRSAILAWSQQDIGYSSHSTLTTRLKAPGIPSLQFAVRIWCSCETFL